MGYVAENKRKKHFPARVTDWRRLEELVGGGGRKMRMLLLLGVLGALSAYPASQPVRERR
jgi:hypothetical protein